MTNTDGAFAQRAQDLRRFSAHYPDSPAARDAADLAEWIKGLLDGGGKTEN